MTTLTRLNSDMGDILLNNLNTPAQDCNITMPTVSGKSAYELAVENGYTGSLQDWLSSLSGWKPIDSEFANYLEQHLSLSSLFNSVNSKIEANKAELDTRIEERISEAKTITTQLQAEAEARVADTQQLSKDLLDEANNRINSIGKLTNDIQSESLIRTSEIEQLHADLQFEQTNRVAEINKLTNITIDHDQSIASVTEQLKTVSDDLDKKLEASIIEDYYTKIKADEVISAKINALKTSYIDIELNKKFDATAITSYYTKSDTDLAITNKIDDLKSNYIDTALNNKLDANVISNYYTTTATDNAIAGQIDSFKTSYVLTELNKKFDASSINNYYTKTDADSAIASKIDSFKTSYVDSELNKKFDASAISNYYTKSQADSAITNKIDTFNASLEIGGRNYYRKSTNISAWDGVLVDRNHPDCPNGFSATGDQDGINTVRLSNVITGNGKWTVSGFVKGSQSTPISFSVDIADNTPKDIYVEGTNEWQKFSVTSDVQNYTEAVYNFVDFSGLDWAYFFFKDIKIEKGSRATDWSPAPEDVDQKITDINANITNNYYTKAKADEAIASHTSDIRTTVGDHTTSIQQHAESINGIKANWTLKLNANGRISGMTLMNDGSTSEFAIEADNFYVGAIGSSYKPFQVKTVGWTGVDGKSYPSGVYINNAVIGDLDAKVIRAGTITADKLAIGTPGNLINNFSKSKNISGWTGNITGLHEYTSFDGTPTPCIQQSTDWNTAVQFDWIEIDPSKSYEISIWLWSEGNNQYGSDYFGTWVKDRDGNGSSFLAFSSVLNGQNGTWDDGNPYFLIRSKADTSWKSKWIKYTGYILAAGTDVYNLKGTLGQNITSNFKFRSTAKWINLRVLNFYNNGVNNHLWMAHPTVREVDTASLLASVSNQRAINDLYYPGTTQIDGGKIQTGSITADRIQIGSLGSDRLNSTFVQGINDTKTKLDNLKVGSSNLLLKSNVQQCNFSNDYYFAGFNISKVLEVGKTYTLVCHSGNSSSQQIGAWVNGSQHIGNLTMVDGGISTLTFVRENSGAGTIIDFYNLTRTSGVCIYWAVLVEGNASGLQAWSPSPYELENSIKDIFDDNKITPDEKQTLLVTYKQIQNDNDIWRNQAYLIGLDYTRQQNAVNTVLSGSRPYLGWVCRSDALSQTDTLNPGERTTLMNSIAEYHSANQDLAQRVGSNLRSTGQTALSNAGTAQSKADSAYNSANYVDKYNVDLDSLKTTGKYFVRSCSQGEIIPGTDNELRIWMYLVVDAAIPTRITQTAWHDQTPDKVWTRVWTEYWQPWKRQTDTQVIKNLIADPNVNTIASGARDLLNRWKANGNGTLYIDDNHIAVNKIGANEIAAGAITADHIYGDSITGDKIKANTSITAPNIIGGSINGSSININENFKVDSQGNLTARSGTFEGTVLANKISGTIDVESLKSSAWMGGYITYIMYGGYINYVSHSILIPSKGAILSNFPDYYAVYKIKYSIDLLVKSSINISQYLIRVDDDLDINVYQNGVNIYTKHYNGGYRNQINIPLPSGLCTLEFIVTNTNGGQCGLVLLGDFIDNVNIKYR